MKIFGYWFRDKVTGEFITSYTAGQHNKKEVLEQYSGNGQRGWSLRNVYLIKPSHPSYSKAKEYVTKYVL